MTVLVHVTTVHPRFDTRIFRKECGSLRDAGYKVSLVVADGNGDATVDGIDIHDVGGTTGRLRRMLLLPLRAFNRVRSLKPATVHFHDPELLPMAFCLRMLGYKVIYDAHEDLPRAILSKHWIKPAIRSIVASASEFVEDFCSRRLNAVVTATPHIAKRFRAVQPTTISVTNYPILSETADAVERQPDPRTFAYIGAISRKRSAVEMVKAAAIADARIVMAGPFESEALKDELAAMPEWKNVEYLGIIKHDRVWKVMAGAAGGLLLFYPEPNPVNSVPNKMFEYMAGGLPILCSDFEDWREIVVANDIGLTCDPVDPHSIAEAMRRIIDDPEAAAAMGQRGRDVVMAKYRWENEAAKLVALYEQLLPGQGGARSA